MIVITCDQKQVSGIKRMIVNACKKVGYTDHTLDKWIEFCKCENGFGIDDIMYFDTAHYDEGGIILGREGFDLTKMFGKIKKKHPEIAIDGAITIGDDNHRNRFYFKSKSGSLDVIGDYAYVYGNTEECPLHENSWFPYLFYHDYGEECLSFETPIEAVKLFERIHKLLSKYGKLSNKEAVHELFYDAEISLKGTISFLSVSERETFRFLKELIEKLQSDIDGQKLLSSGEHDDANEMIKCISIMIDSIEQEETEKQRAKEREEAISLDSLDVMYSTLGYAKKKGIKLDFHNPELLNKAVAKVTAKAQKGDLEAKFIVGKLFITEFKDKRTGKKLIREAAEAGYELAQECIENNPKVFLKK